MPETLRQHVRHGAEIMLTALLTGQGPTPNKRPSLLPSGGVAEGSIAF